MARDVGLKWLIPRWMLHLPPWGDQSGKEHFVVGGARQDHAGTMSPGGTVDLFRRGKRFCRDKVASSLYTSQVGRSDLWTVF